jgi:hypothetical protein
MPPPPPPPPPGPPRPPPGPSRPSPARSQGKGGGSNDRGDLLKSIQGGKALKKTVTNDRSTPTVVSGGKSTNNTSSNDDNNSNSNGRSQVKGAFSKKFDKTIKTKWDVQHWVFGSVF